MGGLTRLAYSPILRLAHGTRRDRPARAARPARRPLARVPPRRRGPRPRRLAPPAGRAGDALPGGPRPPRGCVSETPRPARARLQPAGRLRAGAPRTFGARAAEPRDGHGAARPSPR